MLGQTPVGGPVTPLSSDGQAEVMTIRGKSDGTLAFNFVRDNRIMLMKGEKVDMKIMR
jgi:hypothetical protein